MRSGWAAILALFTSAAACVREPLELPCPAAGPGDLVVTELRGAQETPDAEGEWIELHNAGADVDLRGAVLMLRKLNGTSPARIVVRDPLLVPAGGYAVLGRFPRGAVPDHVDYGYAEDFDGALPTSGAIDIESCGLLVHRAVYRHLPNDGSFSFECPIASTTLATPGEQNQACE